MALHYIELHARSAFSFLRGASTPEAYADRCASLDQPGMALLDLDGLYGTPRFHQAMRKQSLTPFIGAEVLCTDGARYPLLVETRTGYQNLCRMITRMKLRTSKHPKPGQEAAVTPEELAEFSSGLLCLTGSLIGPNTGPLAQALSANPHDPEQWRRAIERLHRIFGPRNVYLEIQRHHDRDQEALNQAVIDLARSMQLPLVATNGACYATARERELLDVFTCLYHKTTLDRAGRLLASNAELYLKSTQEMARLFADIPDALANTVSVAQRLRFTLADLGYEFPHYPVPDGETEVSFLRKRTEEGARRRYGDRYEKARPQIERELALIEKLGFQGYFLIVWDIIRFCQQQGILVQGRGSAANSAVCYSLEITAVDPVGMDLLFERFLSEQRGEWPDIDLDLPSGDQRERAIQYVYQRYGELGAAMTANVITYRGRSAAREAGKALGFDEATIGTLSKLVPMWGWHDDSDTPEKQFREAGLDLASPRVRKFHDLVVGLQDLPRHLGQHSGGMVICQGQLDSVVPLEPSSMPGRVVVQWDKEDCADMGIIKVDLLGLGMLAVLEETIELIGKHESTAVDLGNLPADDPATYAVLQRADSIGMFQVESRAQQASLPRMKPERFYDLVVQVAIIRPGPIAGKMAHPYLKRRQGREKPEPLHPLLEPILKRTLGVPLFQEQLIRMAMVASGFSGGEAEELRRAFGFKRSEKRMQALEGRLREGMARNGITGETQDRILLSISSFAMYGFPESHAASFALIAYASAYLKTHHLAAFTCAMLNNQPMGFYHPATLIKDAQRHGLRVLPVDINRSGAVCDVAADARPNGAGPPAGDLQPVADLLQTPSLKAAMTAAMGGSVDLPHRPALAIRLGLNYVRGLRAHVAQAIEDARPFASIADLARRIPSLNKEEMEQLASIGALNPIGAGKASHRRDALWQASHAIRPVGKLLEPVPEPEPSSPLEPMNREERLIADTHGTGVTVGPHPMAYRREQMNRLGVIPASGLPSIRNGQHVRVAGNIIVRQRPGTAKGVMFLSLEDETGISNVIIMPDVLERQRLQILGHPWVMVEGKLQNVDNVIHVHAQRVAPLEHLVATRSHDFH